MTSCKQRLYVGCKCTHTPSTLPLQFKSSQQLIALRQAACLQAYSSTLQDATDMRIQSIVSSEIVLYCIFSAQTLDRIIANILVRKLCLEGRCVNITTDSLFNPQSQKLLWCTFIFSGLHQYTSANFSLLSNTICFM